MTNAILPVDYTHDLRKRGSERDDAILRTDHTRLHPILMGSISIIAGIHPIALGKGDDSAIKAFMAMALIVRDTLCLLLTLLVTQVIHSSFGDLRSLRVRYSATAPNWSWLRLRWVPARLPQSSVATSQAGQ